MKILLVDNDHKNTAFVKLGLEESNYSVDVAFDSHFGEKLAFGKKYNIIIMEVLLPGINGFELCKKIRGTDVKTPIMMLTSLDAVEDIVNGFNCGADDYLIKPFNFQELHARIKALDRRNKETILFPTLFLADLEVDTIAKIVKRNNKIIKLTSLEYKMVELLTSNKGKVFERIEIAEKIWGHSFNSGTNVIDVHINSLRNKIAKKFPLKLIHTMVGVGYSMYVEE